MRSWWRGKGVGLLAFTVIAGLVAGGLGWVTLATLRLEQEQLEARAESQIHLALWRLDSRVFTDLAQEANLSYQRYRLESLPPVSRGVDILEFVPLKEAESPGWLGRNFLVARRAEWKSPRVLQDLLIRGLGLAPKDTLVQPITEDRSLLMELAQDGKVQQLLAPASPMDDPALANPNNDLLNSLAQQEMGSQPDLSKAPNAPPQPKVDRDTQARFAQAAQMTRSGKGAYANNSSGINDPRRNQGKDQVIVILEPLIPFWMKDGPEPRLAVSRLVQVGNRRACQVTLLDWSELQARLAAEVHDLLPAMRLEPVYQGIPSNIKRAMTALPVELIPGPPAMPEVGTRWTPLQIGLFLAWTAALVALSAVALGGWSLWNLSERRIRFVSAVTHELRTPLTTLRLYLDMLATGMVQDEKHKADYIQTLNTEADRLNRLVSNVLDFSRLENQRPRLEKSHIALGDLLEQVYVTWQGRCVNAEKELVIDNPLGHGVVVFTDVNLVSQILGNLIDNACKYSRGAEDRRIWVRAGRPSAGRLVLEVEDRGEGVPPRERRSIFRPFRRGRSEHAAVGGVGLGLALACRWAKMLGGKLTLGSVGGKVGACFRVDLPLNVG
jgi:two-component sensor histidine kinase